MYLPNLRRPKAIELNKFPTCMKCILFISNGEFIIWIKSARVIQFTNHIKYITHTVAITRIRSKRWIGLQNWLESVDCLNPMNLVTVSNTRQSLNHSESLNANKFD